MEHALYEVFKHPAPFGKLKWCVQMKGGLWNCNTKREATRVSNACLLAENVIEATDHTEFLPRARKLAKQVIQP